MAEARATKPAPKLADVLRSAGKKALDGGIAGALAMVLQMFALISCADHVPWMRTRRSINYQHKYGTTTREAMANLFTIIRD